MNSYPTEMTGPELDLLIEEVYRQLAESTELTELDALADEMFRDIAALPADDADGTEETLEYDEVDTEHYSTDDDANPRPLKRQRG